MHRENPEQPDDDIKATRAPPTPPPSAPPHLGDIKATRAPPPHPTLAPRLGCRVPRLRGRGSGAWRGGQQSKSSAEIREGHP